MLIEELKNYPKLYAEAVRLRGDRTEEYLRRAFSWYDSPQRWAFWDEVDCGRFDNAKRMRPELFEQETAKESQEDRLRAQIDAMQATIEEYASKLTAVETRERKMRCRVDAERAVLEAEQIGRPRSCWYAYCPAPGAERDEALAALKSAELECAALRKDNLLKSDIIKGLVEQGI